MKMYINQTRDGVTSPAVDCRIFSGAGRFPGYVRKPVTLDCNIAVPKCLILCINLHIAYNHCKLPLPIPS